MSQHITLQGGRFPASPSSVKSLIFDIDPSKALFVKEGEALVIQPAGGTPTVIEAFFSSVRSGGDTEFILADGTTLNGKEFFQAYSPNLVTAMGPAAAPSSSGGGAYDDDAGLLIGGVDRFGAAGAVADASNLRASHLETPVSQVAGLPSSDSGDAEDSPAGPQPLQDPDCRFVLYGNAADRASWTSGIRAVPPANGGTAGIASVGDGAYGTAHLLPDGSIKYIPALGAADWPKDGGPLVDRIVITLSDGSTRVIEVLLVDGTTYDAAGHTDLGGERHEGLVDGVYTVTATAHDDVFARRTGSVGLAAGSTLDMGAGDDTLLIQAAGTSGGAAYGADRSTVRMGEGDDSVHISVSTKSGNAFGISGGLLDLGSGDDVLQLTTSALGYNASAYAVAGGAKIGLGDGDNAVNISSDSQSRYAYGIYSDVNGPRSSVVAGNGNDTLRISVQPGSYGSTVTNSLINLGDGDNLTELNVRGISGASLYGLERSEVINGSGNDTLAITMTGGYGIYSSTVKMGNGDNLLTVAGADGAILGTVVMGSGNDSLLIDDTGSSTSLGKYGIFGSSNVDMGSGDDLVEIRLSGGSAEALRGSGLDMGAGNDTVSFQVTGTAYSSAGGLNDSARLYMGAGDDLLTISATTRNSGYLAFGMHNSSLVELGDGNDTMRMDATVNSTAVNVFAYGMASARIAAGNGNDDVRLRASASTSAATGTAEADGMNSAAIDMGAGDDTLIIEASASGTNAIARDIYSLYYQNTVDGGAGNDSIHLSATAAGTLSSLAVGVGNATLLAGTGDDTLDVSILATGNNAVAMGLQQAGVDLGDGNDVARFDVRSDGDAYGLTDGTNGLRVTGGTVLDLGGGNDSLSIDVHAGHNAYGIYNSTLSAGSGDDRVEIIMDGAAGSWGVFGSKIDMGDGHDCLSIKAGATGLGTAVEGSGIDLGAGNDTLEIAGAVHNATVLAGLGKDMLHIDGAVIGASLIDAGADDDLIILGANFSLDGQARITGGTGIDVLKFDAGMDFFDFTAHTGRVSGLEHLDLTDGAHEIVLGLDDIHALTNDASGVGLGEALRIRGDADDAVRLTGSGWTIDTGSPVTLTESDGSSHTYYAASNGATTVYIDEQIRLDMLSITG